MDPVQTGNPLVDELRELTQRLAQEVEPSLTIHDFRITSGPLFTNLIFDLVLPFDVKLTEKEVKDALAEKLTAVDPSYRAVIDVDRTYVR